MEAKDVLTRMILLSDSHKAKLQEKQDARRKLGIEIDIARESQDLIEESIREVQEMLSKIDEKAKNSEGA